ncbi:MAG: ATP-binding protein [Ignavibacteria bacterium]|nr:ATP-binding protein [Ignavibacteria bacterium]
MDQMIEFRLTYAGAIVLEGPKACGKTVTARRFAASEIRADTEKAKNTGGELVARLAVEGATPRLIDEWQEYPEIWNVVRRAVDDRGMKGQFILTGSARPPKDSTRHSGAGRFSRLRMWPLTLFELGLSTNAVSFGDLLNGIPVELGTSALEFGDIIEHVLTGGWPSHIGLTSSQARHAIRDYVEESIRIDVAQIGTTTKSRDPNKIRSVLQSMSRGVGAAMNIATIANDVGSVGDRAGVSEITVSSYIDALERSMLISMVPAWNTHLRSKVRLRTTRRSYFADPSIATAAADTNEYLLRRDTSFLGQLFENLVMRDLFVYAQLHDATVSYYRDSDNLEVDAIVEKRNGDWIAIEIKLSPDRVVEASSSLIKFRDKINLEKKGEPKALIVLTGTGHHYQTTDGISVVPIGALTV